MWTEFFFAIVVCTLLLYVPGYPFFRGLRFSRMLALCCAPLFSMCMYALLPVLYYEVGIACNLASVAGPAFALGFVTFLVARLRSDKIAPIVRLSTQRPVSVFGKKVPFDVAACFLFVLLATVVCAYAYWRVLPAPDAINQRKDNITHLNLVRSFLETGRWSSLHTSIYAASFENMRAVAGEGPFYPAGWNCIVVLTCLASGVRLMTCVNAVVSAAAICVFPLGALAFLRALLPEGRRAVLLGAVAATGFANWPWFYINTGPLYPNQLGVALQMSAMALAICVAIDGVPKKQVPCVIAAAGIAFVALGLTHPSTIFSMYVYLAFFIANQLVQAFDGKKRICVVGLFALGVVGFWTFCYQLPMLQDTIGYVEKTNLDALEVLATLLSMRFDIETAQVGMVFACIVGCVVVARRRGMRWMMLPVAFFGLGYIASQADWWFIKHWLCGLWYSDYRRLSVNYVLCLMPIAAMGFDAVLSKADQSAKLPAWRFAVVVLAIALVYVPRIYVPLANVWVDSPLTCSAEDVRQRHVEGIYSNEEIAFVNKVMQVIPKGALVVNSPADGSMWAYGYNGINAMFRSMYFTGNTPNAEIIRTQLREYATNVLVRKAVREMGATYLLHLDHKVPFEDGVWLWQYTPDQMAEWIGVDDIDETTPGFTEVLREGDHMRLYRIDTDLATEK